MSFQLFFPRKYSKQIKVIDQNKNLMSGTRADAMALLGARQGKMLAPWEVWDNLQIMMPCMV